MSEIRLANGNTNNIPTTPSIAIEQGEKIYLPAYTDTIFQKLATRDVEQFYKTYHFWLLQRRINTLQTEIEAIQQAITDNTTLMQQVQPSTLALASLAQLQASGVNDLNLLDRMLERGETWLDHTMQLLEQCEKMDLIRGDYTQWCAHALEGAYDWIESINATTTTDAPENTADNSPVSVASCDEQYTGLQTPTEEQLLQKLMSEEATEKMPALHLFDKTEQEMLEPSFPNKKITQPLDKTLEPSLLSRKITQPLDQLKQEGIGSSSPIRKSTQPLEQGEALVETERELNSTLSDRGGERTTAEPQIDRMKDIIAGPGEEGQERVVQEAATSTNEVESAYKDADVHTMEAAPEGIVVSEAPSDQADAASVQLIESQNKKPNMQLQKHGGFWRFLYKLLTIFHRKR